MYDLINDITEDIEILDEMSYNEILRKQRSITSLFPQFYSRVDQVGKKGGVRLKSLQKDRWLFKVHSGTKDDVWYDVILQFDNVLPVIKKHVYDRRLWKKDRTGVDLRKLAKVVLFDIDFKVSCSDPSFLYWGMDYIVTKRGAKSGEPEDRRPKIRNPKEYGSLCKHLQLAFNVLPAYITTFAKYLNKLYSKQIIAFENEVKAEDAKLKQATDLLKQKSEEEN